MPQGPAARITDNVIHPLPPVLTPGPGSPNVIIGFLPAWRGIPLAAAAALQAAKQVSDVAIQAAESATLAAAGTPGAPAAYAAEQAAKTAALASLSSTISGMAGMSDIHAMNGLKLFISSTIALVAVARFVLSGTIDWYHGSIALVGVTTGGYVAARLAKYIPTQWIRIGVIVYGIAMTGYFFWTAYGQG